MDYPEGYFSIRDSISEIMKTEGGRAVVEPMLQKAMAEFGGTDFKPNKQMLKMMEGMSIERLVKMAGKQIDPTMVVALNRALNEVKKP